MTDNLEQKSFFRRQWEAYKLVDETVRNKSLVEDFIAADPVNGPIVCNFPSYTQTLKQWARTYAFVPIFKF